MQCAQAVANHTADSAAAGDGTCHFDIGNFAVCAQAANQTDVAGAAVRYVLNRNGEAVAVQRAEKLVGRRADGCPVGNRNVRFQNGTDAGAAIIYGVGEPFQLCFFGDSIYTASRLGRLVVVRVTDFTGVRVIVVVVLTVGIANGLRRRKVGVEVAIHILFPDGIVQGQKIGNLAAFKLFCRCLCYAIPVVFYCGAMAQVEAVCCASSLD